MQFSIAIDLSHMMPMHRSLTANVFPNLAHAVRIIAHQAQEDWKGYAYGHPLPTGQVIKDRSGQYAQSILLHETGPFSVEVRSEAPKARGFEEGFPASDMKKMLDTSFKVRRSKAGKRYLIIPFRHNVDTLPQGVVEFFKSGAGSSITGTFLRRSGQVASDINARKRTAVKDGFNNRVLVPGWRYSWGSKLGAADLAALPGQGPHSGRLVGMYNFRNPGGAAGGGAKAGSHSQYMTFRTMVEGSSGWIKKATPGMYPARTVAEALQPVAERLFAAAMQSDVEEMMGGSAS